MKECAIHSIAQQWKSNKIPSYAPQPRAYTFSDQANTSKSQQIEPGRQSNALEHICACLATNFCRFSFPYAHIDLIRCTKSSTASTIQDLSRNSNSLEQHDKSHNSKRKVYILCSTKVMNLLPFYQLKAIVFNCFSPRFL